MPARFETDRHVAQGIDTTTRQDDGRPCHAEQAGSHPARPIPRRYCAGETGDLQPGCDAGGCEPTWGGWAGQAASGATPRARRRGRGPRPEAALSRSSLAGPARGHARSIRDHAEHTRRPAADQRSRGAAVATRGLRQRVLPFRTDPLEGVVVIARQTGMKPDNSPVTASQLRSGAADGPIVTTARKLLDLGSVPRAGRSCPGPVRRPDRRSGRHGPAAPRRNRNRA